ncbi:MAG: methionine--tRNA ligase [Acidobacteriota bacterium]|jgi:methionyl-tRNA synthetase
MSSFYITTPIYYVNDLPHIGHIYSTVITDVIARYHRLAGEEVYFLTGTDEHGQKIERAAADAGVEPIALADRVVSRYHELWKELGISHDDFIRTTEERHARGVLEIVERIRLSGDFYTDRHEGWYCTACETFYTEKELVGNERLCPDHETPTEWKSEENVFFRLSRYAEPLLEWYRTNPEAVRPETRLNEMRSFVESGLRDLSVSRADLEWGIPFPGEPGQTIYVWLDALTNYISALGFGRSDEEGEPYRTFWEGDGTRIHLVGKDILRFHAVYWPAFLMSAGLPLPTTVWAHGWWLRDERKVSKSAGNVVRPDHLIERFGGDSLRFFLTREMHFGHDASFSDEGFVGRYNSDLANDLGNTVSRLVTLSRKNFDGRVPPRSPAGGEPEGALAAAGRTAIEDYRRAMDGFAFDRALDALWRLLSEANSYLVEHEPWKMLKDESRRAGAGEILWNGLEAVRIVAVGLLPVMPKTAPAVLRAIGAGSAPGDFGSLAWGRLESGAELPEPRALFPRIDKEAYLEEMAAAGSAGSEETDDDEEDASMISIDQFFETELRTATIKTAEPIPKSNKLLKLTVDLGGETRQLVAGIARQYEPEALVGRQVVVVANLEPAKLMGVESQGMVLAADVDGAPILLQPETEVPNGTRVR